MNTSSGDRLDYRLQRLLLVLGATGLVASCLEPPSRECERSVDCPENMYCRLGSCRPLAAELGPDERDGRASADGHSSARAADGSRAPTDDSTSTSDMSDAPPRCPDGRTPTASDLVLNEILPNVPVGPDGDANGDGVRDASDDEFIELVNRSTATLDLAGVTIREDGDEVATFRDLCLSPGQTVVVFGGLEEEAHPDVTESAEVRTDLGSLGLANSGGHLRIDGRDGNTLASFEWSSAPAVAFTLRPQVHGNDYVRHVELDDDRMFSPGTCARGDSLPDGCRSDTSDADAGP